MTSGSHCAITKQWFPTFVWCAPTALSEEFTYPLISKTNHVQNGLKNHFFLTFRYIFLLHCLQSFHTLLITTYYKWEVYPVQSASCSFFFLKKHPLRYMYPRDSLELGCISSIRSVELDTVPTRPYHTSFGWSGLVFPCKTAKVEFILKKKRNAQKTV